MKKISLLIILGSGISFLALTGYSSGPAAVSGLNRTGAAGSSASCSGGGCHSGATANTSISGIVLTDNATGIADTNHAYLPGHSYNVVFTGSNTASLPKFGFQFTATLDDNTQGGAITASAASTHVTVVNGLSIAEHSLALTGASGTYSSSFTWTAPAAGTGDVTFYGMLNAVNGNNQTSGDQPAANGFMQKWSEAGAATAVSSMAATGGVVLYPNPAALSLRIKVPAAGCYTVEIVSATGQETAVRRANAAVGNDLTIPVADLATGSYFARITRDGKRIATLPFVKN